MSTHTNIVSKYQSDWNQIRGDIKANVPLVFLGRAVDTSQTPLDTPFIILDTPLTLPDTPLTLPDTP